MSSARRLADPRRMISSIESAPRSATGHECRPDPRSGDRARARSARFSLLLPVLALLCGLCGLFSAQQAQAQADNVLVSNMGQTIATRDASTVYAIDLSKDSFATGFTTGSFSGGYTLASIETRTRLEPVAQNTYDLAGLKAELWSSNSGAPNARIVSLTATSQTAGPVTVGTGTQIVTFTPPPSTRLSPDTTYHLVMYRTDSVLDEALETASTSEDAGGETGWSIADGFNVIEETTPPSGTWVKVTARTGFLRVRGVRTGSVTPPAAPSGLALSASSGFNELLAAWTAPSGTVTGYEVQYTSATVGSVANTAEASGTDPTAGWVAVSRNPASTTPSQPITGLTIDQFTSTYRVRVRAINNGVPGAWAFQQGQPQAPPDSVTWAGTLTVRDITNNADNGCNNGASRVSERCSTAANLTPGNTFTVGGTSYSLNAILVSSSGYFQVIIGGGAPNTALRALNFCVGTTSFAMSSLSQNGGAYDIQQSGTSLRWSPGDRVSLRVASSSCDTNGPVPPTPGLTGLSLTSGGEAVDLSPEFAKDTTSYAATVPSDATSVVLTPAWSGSATVTARGETIGRIPRLFSTSGSSSTVNLASSGATRVTVSIIADGGTQSYNLTITREAPPKTWRVSPADRSAAEGTSVSLTVKLSAPAPEGGLTFTATPLYGVNVPAEERASGPGNICAGDEEASEDDIGSNPPTMLTVQAGASEARLDMPLAKDLLPEANECFAVQFATTAGGWSLADGGRSAAEITILNRNPPGAPTGLEVEPDEGTLALTWTAPTETGGEGLALTGYDVHYTSAPKTGNGAVADDAAASGADPATAWVAVPRGTEENPPAASQTIPGLTGDTEYRVRVRAKTFFHDGSWEHRTGTPDPVVSDVPQGLTVTPGNTKLDLAWTAPAVEVTGYDVQYAFATVADDAAASSDPATGWVAVDRVTEDDPPTASQEIANLTNGTEYRVRVRAKTGEGEEEQLSAWAYETGTPKEPAPAITTGLGVTQGDGQLGLSWTAPSSGTVTGYDVEYTSATVDTVGDDVDSDGTDDPANAWVVADRDPEADPLETSQIIPNLNNGTVYRVRVRAKNSGGVSDWDFGAGTPQPEAPTVTSPDDTSDPDDPDAPDASVDLKPSFGTATIADQSYMEGRVIGALTLPAATGGDAPLRYSLTPAAPAGLTLAAATRLLSGTPSRPQAARGYTWTVTDVDGDTASLDFTIMVEAAPVHDPQAWLTRFGRTVGQQVVDAIETRRTAERTPGFSGTFAGQALPTVAGREDETLEDGEAPETQPEIGRLPVIERLRDWLSGDREAEGVTQSTTTAVGMEQVISGTAFTLTQDTDNGSSLGFWGAGAYAGFSGWEGDLSLEGDVTSFMLGTDWERGSHLFGLMLAHSRGSGSYSSFAGTGEIESRLTSLVPYAHWDVNDRVSVWGAFGVGQGDLTLTPEDEAGLTTDINWRMAAAGADGALGQVERLGGANLRWTTDALWTRTTSDAARGLLPASGDTTRLRFGLETGWERDLASGAVLTPRLEMAARYDGGDAETGFGLEIGGGVDWFDASRGLEVGLTGRRLVLHQEDRFEDWGIALSMSYDPTPWTKRGFSAGVSRSLGGASSGGVAALLGPQTFPTASGSGAGTGTWNAEMAYGVSRGRGMVASPYTRLSGGGGAEQALLGYRVEPDAAHAADINLDLWLQSGTADTGETAGGGLNWRW